MTRKHGSDSTSRAPERDVLDDLPFDPSDRSLPRGLRLFGGQLTRLKQALDSARNAVPVHGHSDTLLGEALYQAKARTPLFMLEGLARVAGATTGDKATFTDVRVDVKALEDLLGEVDFWWVVVEKGREWNVPPGVSNWANKHLHNACGRVDAWLMSRAWIDHRYLPQEGEIRLRVHRIGKTLERIDWPGANKERRRLVTYLSSRLRDIHEASALLDLTDIEHGLHELRRKLRWISIYAAALDGGVQLDAKAKPPKDWDRYLTPAVVNNPFNKLPKGESGAEPVMIPAPLFYALSWIIYELGEIKDRAQWTETLADGLRIAKVGGGAKPKRWLGEKAITRAEAGKLAAAMAKKTLFDDRLLLRLAAAIEAQK